MDSETRNSTVQELTRKFLSADASSAKKIPTTVSDDLYLVFSSEKRSFREIVFTINLSRIIDLSFQATKDLYACNPRPVYEQGIKPILDANGVPCTQSGPLNVTKATKAISEQWAAMKSPKNVGLATFRLAKYIDSLEKDQLIALASRMGKMLIDDAKYIEEIAVQSNPLSDFLQLRDISQRLILEAMDGGNTAQRLIGILLEVHREFTKSQIVVEGVDDSASTTNLTSKKVGDLSTHLKTGEIVSIYEVTLKGFTDQRIVECSQSLIGTLGAKLAQQSEVIVLCRKEDVPSSAKGHLDSTIYLGGYRDKFGIQYNFIDIFEWVGIKLLELNEEMRIRYFQELETYVNRVKTPIRVKSKWSELIQDMLSN